MPKKKNPQSPEVEEKEIRATPETAEAVAAAQSPEKEQKYLPILLPRRGGAPAMGWQIRSDFIRHFKIDAELSGAAGATGPIFAKKIAGSRKSYVAVDDPSGDAETFKGTAAAVGVKGGAPRGKVIKVWTGTTTTEGLPRIAQFRIPSNYSLIETCHWIKEFWKEVDKRPAYIMHWGRRYSVEGNAAGFAHMAKLYTEPTP